MAKKKKRSRQDVSVDLDAERRHRLRHTNKEALSHLPTPEPHHPQWYHELGRRIKEYRFIEADDFDDAISELGDGEDATRQTQDGHPSNFRSTVDHDLEQGIDMSQKDWQIQILGRWRLARKHDLGPDGINEIIALRATPEWFQVMQDWEHVSEDNFDEFDDTISALNDECVCFSEGPASCDYHQQQEPHIPSGIPKALRAKFLDHQKQREQRKISLAAGVPTWFQAYMIRVTGYGFELDDAEDLDFDEDLSDLDDDCTCQDSLDARTCVFHQQLFRRWESPNWHPRRLPGFLRRREARKFYAVERERRKAQYERNLARKEAQLESKMASTPRNFAWFRRLAHRLRNIPQPRQRFSYDGPSYVPPEPDTEMLDEDLSELGSSDEEFDAEKVAEGLCACSTYNDNCDCGAYDAAGNYELGHLKRMTEERYSKYEMDMTVDGMNFEHWRQRRTKRKREIRDERKRLQSERDKYDKERSSVVDVHKACQSDVEAARDRLRALEADGGKGDRMTFDTVKRYRLYSPQLAELQLTSDQAEYSHRMNVSPLPSDEQDVNTRSKIIELRFGQWLHSKGPCSLSRRYKSKKRTFSLLNEQLDDDDEEFDGGQAIDLRVTFIDDDHVRLKIAGSSLRQEHLRPIPGHTSSHQKGLGLIPKWVYIYGINVDSNHERQRLQEREAKRAEQLAARQEMSPRDNWFENNHPAGAYYLG